MSLTQKLTEALAGGLQQIDQIKILTDDHDLAPFVLVHLDDEDADFSSLEAHLIPDKAWEIGIYTPDGDYRFTKGERSLRGGWLLLQSPGEVRQALDLFYPVSLGPWAAWKDGSVRIQNLRDKLGRQTGMYRHAANVSDVGAQELIQSVCGPTNKYVKKILWQLDENSPLDDSEASRFNGIVNNITENSAIPLVCQKACNHFVAQAREKSKEEFEAKA